MTKENAVKLIKSENLTRIADEIAAAEGRATVRTISAETLLDTCETMEKYLLTFCTKSAAAGTTVHLDYNAQNFPRAYAKAAHQHKPQSTHALLEYKGGKWYLKDIYRWDCSTQMYSFKLSETARANVLTNLQTPPAFSVNHAGR